MLCRVFPEVPNLALQTIYYSMILISIGTACFLSYRRLENSGNNPSTIRRFMLLAFLIAFPSGLISSHAVSMFYQPRHLWSIELFFQQWFSGTYETFHSCIILPIFLLWVMMRMMKLSPLEMFDTFFVYIPLAHAIGRVACLLVGCCWGNLITITLFGKVVQFENPIPLYELIMNVIIYRLLSRLHDRIYSSDARKIYSGMIIALYLVFYGMVRFVLEIFRKEPVIGWGMTQAQIAMIVYISIGVMILLWIFFYRDAISARRG